MGISITPFCDFVCSGSYSWPNTKIVIPESYKSIVNACLTIDPNRRPDIDSILQMLDASSTPCDSLERVATIPPHQETQRQHTVSVVPNLIDL